MSSHREAPQIAQDPLADNTDVYAFVSPDRPDTVTLIANFIPFETPDGGPNFYEFADDVLYEINIDNDGDGIEEISYQFRFRTQIQMGKHTFLYNSGPIASLNDRNWHKRQFFSVTRVKQGQSVLLADGLACPPCNIGPLSTPNYSNLAAAAIHLLPDGETVFAGQRAEGFYADLGAVFDLLDLRPVQELHITPRAAALGINGANRFNVHSIALQISKSLLTRDGSVPTNPSDPRAVIGVYASANRRKARVLGAGTNDETGPWVQVSRLGNPMVNQIMIPLGVKDLWNSKRPIDDAQFASHLQKPEVAKLLPSFYPGVFPNLAAYALPRLDIVALLLTGIQAGVIPGFQNYSGTTLADLLRLNLAIGPATLSNPLGVLGGDLAGYPNGRRVQDDVFTILLRALAGATIPLFDTSFTPDAAAGVLTDGLSPSSVSSLFLTAFPYLGLPYDGFDTPGV